MRPFIKLCQPKSASSSIALPRANPTASCGTIGGSVQGCAYGNRIVMVAMEEMLPGLVPSAADRAVRYSVFMNFLLLFSGTCLDSSRRSVASAGVLIRCGT
eukprot:13902735-Ditylum_brightwellii.AAC.1